MTKPTRALRLAILLACLALQSSALHASKPNVLFIAVDDLRPELGCYGANHIISPHINKLAASGVRFDRAYCQQAICGPSRASVMTGLRPDSIQVHGNHKHFRKVYPNIVTLPQLFKNNGYHARAMGKIYHGVFPEGSSKTVADTFGDAPSWSVPAFRPGPRYYYTEEGISAAKETFARVYGEGDWTQKLVFGPATEAPDVSDSTLYDGQVADRAVASLKEFAKKKDEPFFLAVGFIKPHSPYIAPKKYWDLYDPEEIELAPADSALPAGAPKIAGHGSGELRRYTDQQKKGAIPETDQRRVKHAYYACISYIDAQVGRVLTELENQGLDQNTTVVLWGDHGYHLGEKGLWGKTTNFELDTRVPLIVRNPDAKANHESCERLVELVDLFPTLAEVAGIKAPSHLEGTSLLPLLDDPHRPWKEAAFSQYTRGIMRGYSIRTEHHRLTEWINTQTLEGGHRQLYEYADGEESAENTNFIGKDKATAERLTQMLGFGHGWKQVQRKVERLISKPEFALGFPFTDHMVLPRNVPVPIYGTAEPNAAIEVRFAEQLKFGKAGADGRWSVELDPLGASGSGRALTVSGEFVRVVKDVIVGDVWLASGQSNMRWMLKQSKDANKHIAAAANPNLRLLDLTGAIYPTNKAYGLDQLRSTNADNYYATTGWQKSTPESAASFSAVAYHFGQHLQSEIDVPIGIIHNAIGGTPMQSWIPQPVIAGDPILRKTLPDWLNNINLPEWTILRARQNLKTYHDKLDGPPPHHPFEPGFLYHAGVEPFTKFPVKGIIWYQGESNATEDGAGSPPIDPALNKHTFKTLIESWRVAFSDPELPFYYAQLPGLNRDWPLFREMQLEVSEEMPHTGMVVTIDLGHPTNVHPTDKEPVGKRLALLAIADIYRKVAGGSAKIPGLRPPGHSPRVTSRDGDGSLIFDQAVMTSDGQAPRGLEIAGEDKKFYAAEATIVANLLHVSAKQVPSPKAIRYGWANDPDVNLISSAGLPVSPFRTDRWTTTAAKQAAPMPEEFERFGGKWHNGEGLVELDKKLARSGGRCVHLLGSVEFTPTEQIPAKAKLDFWAERWTVRDPFTFRVEAKIGDKWQEIHIGDKSTRVGRGFLNHVVLPIPEGTTSLRFKSTGPKGTGVLLDDLRIAESKPMRVVKITTEQPICPILIGKKDNPITQIIVETEGDLEPLVFEGASLLESSITYMPRARLNQIEVLGPDGKPIGEGHGSYTLSPGRNVITVTATVDPKTKVGTVIGTHLLTKDVTISGKSYKPEGETIFRGKRVGFALRQSGQDKCHTYRIPGIATTNKGTLIAVYDNRYRGGGDLPGDIDVGMSRSADGGQTWEPMKVIMDMGDDPKWRYDGVGDPAILVDKTTGTIWVAATWSHGNRSWHGSGPGMKPEETGQFMLSKSDDDGVTWSEPINITAQIKDPKWRFVLQGPGNGITLKDGTIVFPAQYRSENEAPNSGKPYSTIIYSKDKGKTWKIGSGVKIDTTEAQVVQLGDGSIMINCRDNRGGSRSVYTTKDLGATWQVHPTSRKALREPVCNADLMRVVHKEHGAMLIFSNPDTTRGRNHFTLKVSRDEGLTWPEEYHHLYDERGGAGYSTLTQIDEDHIGVLYEGPGGLCFLKYSIAELLD